MSAHTGQTAVVYRQSGEKCLADRGEINPRLESTNIGEFGLQDYSVSL